LHAIASGTWLPSTAAESERLYLPLAVIFPSTAPRTTFWPAMSVTFSVESESASPLMSESGVYVSDVTPAEVLNGSI
jgi:hypothetical protein